MSSVYRFLPFLLVVIAASIFRITNLDLIEFKADEAINLYLASRPLFGHPFPQGGIVTSVGILNPPLFIYLLFPFVAISRDPQFISLLIALLNSLAIGCFFLVVKRYYGFLTSFSSSLLFAFSPWAILFSRKIWPPDLVLPLFIPFFYSLHKIILEKKMAYWIICVTTLIYLIQLDLSYSIFSLVFVLLLYSKKVTISMRYMLIGFLVGVIPLLPYFSYQLKHNFPDFGMITTVKKSLDIKSLTIFQRPFQITQQGNFYFVLGNDTLTFAKSFPTTEYLRKFFYVEYLLLPFGIVVFWKRYKNLRPLVLAVLGTTIAYFILNLKPFMHYFIVLAPLLFLFLGCAFAFFLSSKQIFLKRGAFLLLFLLIGTSIVFNHSFFSLVNRQKVIQGDYGSAFMVTSEIMKKRYEKYKYTKDYEEMILSSYIPIYLIHGSSPLAKILYPEFHTKHNLESLEKRLTEVPEDTRASNQLIAYYTHTVPTKEILHFLRNKIATQSYYLPIYNEAYDVYLQYNYKRVYAGGTFAFVFEYPSHWIVEEYPKTKVIVKTDDYRLIIASSSFLPTKSAQLLDKPKTVQVGKHRYKILYQFEPIKPRELPDEKSDSIQDAIAIMDEIVSTLRKE